MDSATLRDSLELVGIAAVVLSLILVAYEVRQNTIAARASAIQQIGISTAEMWGEIARDPHLPKIVFTRSNFSMSDWSEDDWSRLLAQMVAWSRLAETGYLQVREGLLPPSSLEILGYDGTIYWLQHPALSCLWKHRLRSLVSEDFAKYVESGPDPVAVDCSSFPNYPFLSAELNFIDPDVLQAQ